MDTQKIFLAILGMGLVTFALRAAPACFLSSRQFPPWVVTFLHYVPVAVLSAMLVPAVLMFDNTAIRVDLDNTYLLVTIPTVALALFTRSFLTTVVSGVVFMAVARYFGLGLA